MNKCWDCNKSIGEESFRCDKCPTLKPKIDRGAVPDPDSKVVAMEGKTKVYARDIVQPYSEGRVNQKFMDRYGDGIYNNKKSQLDGKGKEK